MPAAISSILQWKIKSINSENLRYGKPTSTAYKNTWEEFYFFCFLIEA